MLHRLKRLRHHLSLGKTISRLFHPSSLNGHQSRLLHPESLLYFCFIVLAAFGLVKAVRFFPGIEHSILGYASNITAEQVLAQTNEVRQAQGLPSLRLNGALSQAAMSKGQNMFSEQYWSHTSPDGEEPWQFVKEAGYAYKAAGENLARDFSTTGEMMSAWMASPTHQANILNSKFEEIGIAVIDGTLGGFETTLVVQMFGTPAAASPRKVAAGPTPTPQLLENAVEKPVEKPIEQPATTEPTVRVTPEPLTTTEQPQVLSGSILSPISLRDAVLLTPLQLTKAFFLAVIILIAVTLIYDGLVAGHRRTVYAVNKNLGHLMVFGAVTFILVFFRSGMVN
jgi:hypothetical protein